MDLMNTMSSILCCVNVFMYLICICMHVCMLYIIYSTVHSYVMFLSGITKNIPHVLGECIQRKYE